MEHPADTPNPLAEPGLGLRGRALSVSPFWACVAAVGVVVAVFLARQLTAWPPHEDEALALLVGRDSLADVVTHVTRDRGGAPLHFLFAWAVAHAGFGLGGLRVVSASFAVASLPAVALLCRRLAGPVPAVAVTVLCGASWLFLFHGVYGRMYSIFLFVATLSYLLLVRCLDRGARGRWLAWLAATLLCVAAHPYGALVIASQGLAVALAGRAKIRAAAGWFAALLLLATPFWITDLVLAGRFGVGVGGGGATLGGPVDVLEYLLETAGDITAGWTWVLAPVLLVAGVGVAVAPGAARRLMVAVVAVPALAFLAARLGQSAAPESRHLIFAMPFFLLGVALGIGWLAREILPAVAVAVAALVAAQVAWAWHRTPALFEGEPDVRREARAEASAYLAARNLPDDLLLGYDPLFLGAWEIEPGFSRTVLPRADGTLMLRILRRAAAPLGHGVWILDRSDNSNADPQLYVAPHVPFPAGAFETRSFGPFLVVRTREPVRTIDGYLFHARQVMLLGQELEIGDADVNRATIEKAQARYDESRFGTLPDVSSSSSR